jgi:hypothetical protein
MAESKTRRRLQADAMVFQSRDDFAGPRHLELSHDKTPNAAQPAVSLNLSC